MIRDGIQRVFRLAAGGRNRWQHEVEDEIKLHLMLRAEQLSSQGMSPDAAYDEAVRRFGPLTESRARMLTAARHREQRMQRTEYFADLRQDLTFAVRTLRRDKGWATITVLTLALGISATTAVFSVVSSLLLHAVAYPNPDRVVLGYQQPIQGNNTGISVTILPSMPVIRAWKAAHSLDGLEAYGTDRVEMKTTGEPASLQAVRVEPTFPTFAGGHPIIGRMFSQADIVSGAHVVLLGEGAWRTRFGADQSVLGTTITLDDSTYSIVGVLPSRIQAPAVGAQAADVWLPIDVRRDSSGARVVARLRAGVTAQAAEREMDSLSARSTHDKLRFRTMLMTPAATVSFHDSLVMLAASVALVLLVACANVAHLLMARSADRRRELAIRIALGAGRGRVFRQLLTESVVIAASGGVLGVLGGWAGLHAIIGLRPSSLEALGAARVDGTTLGVALVVTLVTSLAFGLLGAVQSARASTNETLKAGGGSGRGSSRSRGRQLLVVTEMALSATLVVGATMLVRSVINLQQADLGFEPAGLYILNPSAPKGHFAGAAARGAALRSLASTVRAIPGVRSVALASTPTGWFSFSIGRLEVDGEPNPSAASSFNMTNEVGSGYFETMGIRIVQGTGFTDTTGSAHQIILNERFVRKQWHGASPIGKRIRVASKGTEPWLTIVGVATDAVTGGPLMKESTAPLIYSPAEDADAKAIMVRATSTDGLLDRVRAATRSVDPALTPKLDAVQAMVDEGIAAPRFVMLLLTMFTILALVLAAIGLYGVMAYTVAQRTREIGIRLALGAPRSRIARGVIAGGVALAVVGCVFGGVVSIWGTKLIENQLYGVAKHDPASMIAAAVVLLGAAVAACVVPARRALGVDPMTAIRAD